jgi:hypothetical protein
MTPDYFKKLKHLFVVYPGATGGNHISNILNLSLDINPDNITGCTTKLMLDYYRNVDYKNSHISTLTAHVLSEIPGAAKILENPEITSEVLNNTPRKNVIIGHEHHWHQFFKEGKHIKLKRYGWLILNFPDIRSLPGQRILQMNMNSQPGHVYNLPYKPYPYALISATDKDSTLLKTERIFCDEGIDYMRDVFLQEFGITIPPEADEIHTIWVKWMKYVCSSEYLHKYGYG